MILIGGTNLTLENLPFSDIVEYAIESKEANLNIKLKTIAKSPNCLGVYLQQDLDNIPLTDDVFNKTTYFSDDTQLIKLLNNESEDVQDTLESDLQEIQKDEEVKIFETPIIKPDLEELPTYEPSNGELVIEEVDTELPEHLLTIPNAVENVDSMQQQLENKDRIIDQKNGRIMDLESQINDIYQLQEVQLLEMKATYEKTVDEANTLIQELTSKVKDAAIPQELHGFLKFATYSQNYKASLREGFSEEELKILGKPTSPIYVFASGAGDSMRSMLENVKALMESNPNAIIVDFSNDYFIGARYRIQTKDSTMLLNDDTVEVGNLVKDANGVRLIPTTFYNDIALLNMNWAKVLKKLMVYASGKPLILLFNNINSFSVRYTVSKLATVGKLYIFAKCNPIILSTLYGDLSFIPENRFQVIATDYIDKVQAILEQLAKKYNVVAVKDSINWGKIGVKV